MADQPSTMDYFVNPYTAEIDRIRRQLRELEDQPLPPMLAPEEAAARRQEVGKNRMYGELGLISRDPAITTIAKPLLEEAIKASQLKQTDHGEYNPLTGEFKYFPSYGRLRKEERLDKELGVLTSREREADYRWQDQRTRAQERRDLALALADKKIGAQGDKPEPGSLTYIGTDPESGQPIMMHSKKGPMDVKPDGSITPRSRPIAPKPSNLTAGEREKLTNAVQVINMLEATAAELAALPKDWRNRATVGVLAGAVASAGRGGAAVMEKLRTDEYNNASQKLFDTVSGLRAGRFGLTLTPNEAADSVQYLPSPYDDLHELARKAKGMAEIVRQHYKTQQQSLQHPGLPAPGLPVPPPVGGAPIPGAGPTPPAAPVAPPAGLPAPVMPPAAPRGGAYADPEKERRYQEWLRNQPR